MKNKKALKLIKNYRWKSIFFHYCKICFTFFMIPVLIIVLLVFLYTSLNEYSNLKLISIRSFSKTVINIEKIFSDADKNADLLISDENLISAVSFSDFNENITEINRYLSELNKSVLSLMSNYPYINRVYAYSFESDYVFGGTYLEDFPYKSLIKKSKEMSGTVNMFFDKQTNSLARAYSIYKDDYKTQYGVLLLLIDRSKLLDMTLSMEEELYIVSEEGELIFSSDDSTEFNNNLPPKTSEYEFEKKNGSVFNSVYIPKYGIYVATKAKSNGFLSRKGIFIFILCVLICLIFTLALSYTVAIKIYSFVADIVLQLELEDNIENMENMENTEKSDVLPQFNEFQLISNNIVKMMQKNTLIESELKKRIAELKQAQSVALQAQISPHFLSNTLNLVNSIVLRITKSDNDATRLISLLSDIFCNVLNTNRYVLTLGEELENLEKYIEIEQIKLLNGFNVLYDISDELKNVGIINFSLQPIVENAIWHSFKKTPDRKGTLEIRGFEEADAVRLEISNDGEVITEEKIRDVTALLKRKEFPAPPHIGLLNVNRRTQLVFGEQYGIELKIKDNKTTVILKIPNKQEEQKNGI